MLSIPHDKLLHLIAGAITAFVIIVLFSILGKASFLFSMSLANIVVFAVAGAKELWDRKQPNHTFDGWDGYWTVAGGLIVTSVLPALKGLL